MKERPAKPAAPDTPKDKPSSPGLTPEASAALAKASAALAAFVAPPEKAEADPGPPASGRRNLIDLFPPASPAESGVEGGTPRPAPGVPASYERFYGLSTNPFDRAYDPRFFFRWESHDRALRDLAAALDRHDGTLLLTGPSGAGKTTLGRALVVQLGRRTLVSFVGGADAVSRDLLETVLVDFGVLSRADAASRLRDATLSDLTNTLRDFLSSLSALQAVALIVIDDAHELPPSVLAELQVLSEMAMEHKLLQVLLVGGPGLTEQLRRTELQPWGRRIRLRVELGPLAEDELAGYVAHRLAVAGAIDSLFDEDAIARVAAVSRGLPGAVNALCDRALTIGARASARVIDEALVDRAARELGLFSPAVDDTRGSPWRGRIALLAVMAALVLAGAATAWIYREPLGRAIATWLGR